MNAFVAAGAGFLLAVLWFDLMFDIQVVWRREAGEGARAAPAARGGLLPEAVLRSIAAYYARVTTAARPMNRLVAAVMLATLAAIVVEITGGEGPDVGRGRLARGGGGGDRRGRRAHGAKRRPARHARRSARAPERAGASGAPPARVLLRRDGDRAGGAARVRLSCGPSGSSRRSRSTDVGVSARSVRPRAERDLRASCPCGSRAGSRSRSARRRASGRAGRSRYAGRGRGGSDPGGNPTT